MAPPTVPTSVHDLRTLVLSRYPAISIDTAEEERAALLITAVATQVHLPVYDWTITKGLGPVGHPGGLAGSAPPAGALANLGDVRQDALFVLYDFARHLGDPAVSRAFRDLLERFSSPSRMSTIILVGTGATLPAEVAPHVITYELTPPTRADYAVVVAAVADSLVATARARVTLTPADHDAFAAGLAGLTINQARQLLARVAIEDGTLDAGDLGRLQELRAAALRDDGLLEFFPPQDNPTELGGLSPPPTTSPSCRRSCCARAASTRSSSSTCPPRPSARRSSASTCPCAASIRRRSTSRPSQRRPTASRAPRSSRP